MTRPGPQWYREPWVWLLIALPSAAVIGGAITLLLAIHSDDGLVVDDYYRQGMEINRLLDRDRKAAEQEIQVRLQVGNREGKFRLYLEGNVRFTPPQELRVAFLHATRAGYDQYLDLMDSGAGMYEGTIRPLVSGKWHIQVETEEWRVLESLQIP